MPLEKDVPPFMDDRIGIFDEECDPDRVSPLWQLPEALPA